MCRSCEFEPLESRQFLTSTLPIATWALTSRGTLVIRGVELEGVADAIAVTRAGDKIRFHANSSRGLATGERFSASRVKRVLVETYSGSDRVYIDPQLGRAVTVFGGAGNDRIDGNPGATLIGGGGNDRLYVAARPIFDVIGSEDGGGFTTLPPASLEGRQGPALLSGGAGNDTLVATATDSVVGGLGDDRAIQTSPVRFVTKPADPAAFAREQWGDRATGIEDFDLILT